MKRVILLSGEHDLPAPALLEALREAGVAATTIAATAKFNGEADETEETDGAPLAVLYEVAAGAEVGELHAAVSRAAIRWPDAPLVACRRVTANQHQPTLRRPLDVSALMRLGFRAIADEPAQLPALLRGLESRGTTGNLLPPPENLDKAPPSIRLPEKLGGERLRAVFETVAALHFANDQKSAAATALTGLAPVVRADRWALYLMGETGATEEARFEPLAVRGITERERALPEDDWRSALRGEALALSGEESGATRTAGATAETVREKKGGQCIIAVPLVSGERVIGVLEAVREGAGARAFSQADVELLTVLALPLAAALANSVRIAEAERLSQTDDLTKLHNARFLRQYLTSEIKRARRYDSMVAAMFLDLDDFKRINDQHGHLVGSHLLMELAAVILASVRDTDVVARYGGDEFVVILPETGTEEAVLVAERVREKIAAHVFTGGRRLELVLTASFGVAAFPQHVQSPQQLIACADAAMYEAKAALKNCVRFATETTSG